MQNRVLICISRYLSNQSSLEEWNSICLQRATQALFTLVCFRFKTHNFCKGYAYDETFENAADPTPF